MKKVLAGTLAALLALGTAGCANSQQQSAHLLNSYIEKLALANAEFNEEDQFLCSVM